MLIRRLFAVAVLVLAASCGHKDTQSTTTTTTVQTPSAGAPVNAVPTGAAGGAMSGATRNGSTNGTVNASHAGGAGNPPGYDTENAAQSHCPSDQVVWLNMRSHIYHEKGTRYYGTTKQGEYTCRKEADAAGDRNSKA